MSKSDNFFGISQSESRLGRFFCWILRGRKYRQVAMYSDVRFIVLYIYIYIYISRANFCRSRIGKNVQSHSRVGKSLSPTTLGNSILVFKIIREFASVLANVKSH